MSIWEKQRRLNQGTSARIVELLRRGPLTIDEIAGAVGNPHRRTRAQLATLQRESIVEERGLQRGLSPPEPGVQAEAELLLSLAYIPILTQLLHVLAERMSPHEFDAVMREVGRGLMIGRAMPQGTIREQWQPPASYSTTLAG